MPDFEKPETGSFCWAEANVENTEQAKAFYTGLFGWKGEDFDISIGKYTLFRIGEAQVAGLLKLPERAKQNGAKPHWLGYIAVTDAAATVKKAEKLGARLFHGPEAFGPGVLAVLADPTGAFFAVWEESRGERGTFRWGESMSLCWCELTSTDAALATRFYVELFGWKTEVFPMGDFDYTVVKNGDRQIAGIMPQPKPMVEAKAPSFWTMYFDVPDCDQMITRASALGSRSCTPAMDIPNVGRFAILSDPDGAAFAVIKNAPRKP